ncbi:MAG: hypothetical protein HZA32_03065 [Opitutae bacterium]|nr:hypothetical protein [Opitutae bacterium]
MNSPLSPLDRAHLALTLLSAARPVLPSTPPAHLPNSERLAEEIAGHATEFSRAFADLVHSGDTAVCSARILAALAAQHDVIRRLHHLPASSEKS